MMPGSNEGEISHLIHNVIKQVKLQLQFKLGQALNFTNILSVYTDVLKLIHFYPNDCDLFSPLVNMVDHNGWQHHRKEIIVMVAILGLENLTNPRLFPQMMAILRDEAIIVKMATLIGDPKNDHPNDHPKDQHEDHPEPRDKSASALRSISKSSELSCGSDPNLDISLIRSGGLTLSDLNLLIYDLNLDALFDKCLITLCNVTHIVAIISIMEKLIIQYNVHHWQFFLQNLINDVDLISILSANTTNFMQVTASFPQSKILLTSIIEVLSPDNFKLIPLQLAPKVNFKLLTNYPSNLNLKISFKLLLSIIDQDFESLNNNKTIAVYINWCLNQILGYSELPSGKSDIYAIYISFRPTNSIATFFQDITRSMLIRSKHSLPPLTKDDWMLDSWHNDFIDEEYQQLVPNLKQQYIVDAATKSMRLCSMFIGDELESGFDSTLNLKINIARLNYLLESLTPQIIPTLISTVDQVLLTPIIWSHFINKLKDICISDLRYVDACTFMLSELINDDTDVDIKTMIESFATKFGGNQSLNKLFGLDVKYVEFNPIT